MKIIHFSKSRPMQYRSFLESFLYNSNIQSGCRDIDNFQYYPIENIISGSEEYPDIIEEFNVKKKLVNFIEDQGKFFQDIIKDLINGTFSDYILFGCDDELVTRKIDFQLGINYLDSNPDCIGFSYRLGTNVSPFPQNAIVDNNIIKWNWRQNYKDYSYPFDCMATIYPTWICQEIVSNLKEIKTPNYFEGGGSNYCIKNQHIPSYMACEYTTSAFYAADINRVQKEFENKTQNFSDRNLSAENLLEMYKNGYRINWKNYQGKIYDNIFIGDKDLELLNKCSPLNL